MKTVLNYVLGISLALLLLIVFAGIFTLGDAFKFQEYSIIGWISLVLTILFVLSVAIIIVHNGEEKKVDYERII